jgi:TatD DNase family protein
MIDSHAHLYFDRFDEDRDEVIARARQAGVTDVINIGIDVPTSRQALELAARHAGFHATVGLHPTTPVDDLDAALDALRELIAAGPRVVAIGEIGLDYHWDTVPPERQKEKLRRQLDLARATRLPVVFHCRDALEDLFEILETEPALPEGVFHCFAGGENDVGRALRLGFHVSFAGNVTYKNAADLRAAAARVPAERLLLETDAPFLAPQPRRGRRNEPAYLPFTRDCLAEVLGRTPQELEALATATTRRLFQLDGSD